ncbi:MAG: hypothetical protein E6H70_01500 [Betaproteobacteria bacterium]|nr:MAG: hypothetical protein E6H70_01500 [Betaproteobacteria bacterium]
MNTASAAWLEARWRYFLLAIVAIGSIALMLASPPIGQDPQYHEFADRRAFFGIPNFWDVVSNIPFLLVGIAGLKFCLRHDLRGGKSAWIVLFAGVALVSVGSSYYHWDPQDATLVWDRLPITITFMGLLVAVIAEHLSARLARVLLAPMLLLGLASVLYWRAFGDLRFYLWVQLIALLAIPLIIVLFRARYTHRWLLLAAFGWHALAKVSELYDREFFALTGNLFSGHSFKHILAAMACFTILWMVRTRKPL